MKGIIFLVSAAVVLAGCSNKDAAPNEKLQVVASIYPMYEFASRVSGEYADVTLLVSGGTEPHDWEPTPQNLKHLEITDVFVYNGAGMEGWIDQVVDSLDNKKLILVEASHGLELLEGEEHGHDDEHVEGHEEEHEEEHEEGHEEHDHEAEHGHDHGEFDPHVWLSPVLAAEQVRVIEKALSKASPEHQEEFKKNADAYIAELKELDKQFNKALSPYKGKEFVTQHAAFAYLAHEYDLVQLPIAGLSPEIEPSAKRMAEIVDYAKEHEIQTIFFESLVSSKVAAVIANELGADTAVLHPLEYLTKDEETNGMDYIQLMEQNLKALEEAFKHTEPHTK